MKHMINKNKCSCLFSARATQAPYQHKASINTSAVQSDVLVMSGLKLSSAGLSVHCAHKGLDSVAMCSILASLRVKVSFSFPLRRCHCCSRC